MSRKGPQEEKFVFLDDNHQTLAGAKLRFESTHLL